MIFIINEMHMKQICKQCDQLVNDHPWITDYEFNLGETQAIVSRISTDIKRSECPPRDSQLYSSLSTDPCTCQETQISCH